MLLLYGRSGCLYHRFEVASAEHALAGLPANLLRLLQTGAVEPTMPSAPGSCAPTASGAAAGEQCGGSSSIIRCRTGLVCRADVLGIRACLCGAARYSGRGRVLRRLYPATGTTCLRAWSVLPGDAASKF